MLVRRRYYTWLIKAYLKRWKRTILYSLVGGIVICSIGIAAFNLYFVPMLEKKTQKIGIAGVYTSQNVPEPLLRDISYGLTEVQPDGKITPKAAEKWEVKNGGREYIFTIRKGQYFHNGEELSADNLNLNFKDVKKKTVDHYTVSYTLSTPYSPFLISASRPLFINNSVGLGDYKIKNLELNAGIIKTMVLQNQRKSSVRKIIYFYPTREALKTAFALGEIDSAQDLHNVVLEEKTDFSKWKNVKIMKQTRYEELVALFYDNTDSELSNKKFRQALNYALPEEFEQGERAFSPIPPNSIYFSRAPNFGITDMDIAKQLLDSSQVSLDKEFTISTTEDFIPVAEVIKKRWEDLGMKVKINTVEEIPVKFQILLYQIKLPKDPDQYTLWHSDQINNIGRFKNLRIDKLLEDGRVTVETEKRQTIYADFQKYLIDDVPASFLYFPYLYTIERT